MSSVRVGASSPTSSAAFSNAGCRPPASHLILGSAAAAAPNGFGYSRGRLLLMTLRAVTWSKQAPPSPLREPPSTSRRGAAPARALACPSACATGARTESAIPKPVLRAGGRVVATAPAPSSARGSSAIIIAGCTSHFHRCSRLPRGQSGTIRQSAHSPRIAWRCPPTTNSHCDRPDSLARRAGSERCDQQGQRDWIPPRRDPPTMDFLAPRGTFWADSAGNPIGFPYVFV